MSLKITPGKWSIDEHLGCLVSKGHGVIRGRIDLDFIAEAGTVANETGLMPRELLAQRDDLLAALEAALIEMTEVCQMCNGRGEIGGVSRCEPGGHSEPCPDCANAIESAKAAIARVRGES